MDSAEGAAAGARAQLAASAVTGVELPGRAHQAASLGNFPSVILLPSLTCQHLWGQVPTGLWGTPGAEGTCVLLKHKVDVSRYS